MIALRGPKVAKIKIQMKKANKLITSKLIGLKPWIIKSIKKANKYYIWKKASKSSVMTLTWLKSPSRRGWSEPQRTNKIKCSTCLFKTTMSKCEEALVARAKLSHSIQQFRPRRSHPQIQALRKSSSFRRSNGFLKWGKARRRSSTTWEKSRDRSRYR